ncbi:MAG: methyltransferase domain-containing protein [Nitrospirota bacterium]|nr:methyltransferase domain-containing protein [Nitrospirota bacterium]MDP2383781.1 methyltransferase domain-containing protein [Nitrospirota bacterium]
MRCDDCGLLYSDQRLGVNESNEYIAQHGVGADGVARSFGNPRVGFTEQNPLVRLLEGVERKGRALDIGTWCGRHTYLYEALGFDSYGLEAHQEAAAFARSKGLQVSHGAFPDDVPRKLLSGKYKLISMLDMLYYLHDLQKSFLKVRKMLKDDGVFVITCHQGYSSYYDESQGNSYFSRYGDYVQGIPTFNGLQYCLEKSGFKILKSGGIAFGTVVPAQGADLFCILSGKAS